MSMKWHGGKGSKQRTVDYAAYNKNYDKIFEKKMGREQITKHIASDDVDDLYDGDIIEWIKFDSNTVQITVMSEALETFQVPADVFEKTYKPTFK